MLKIYFHVSQALVLLPMVLLLCGRLASSESFGVLLLWVLWFKRCLTLVALNLLLASILYFPHSWLAKGWVVVFAGLLIVAVPKYPAAVRKFTFKRMRKPMKKALRQRRTSYFRSWSFRLGRAIVGTSRVEASFGWRTVTKLAFAGASKATIERLIEFGFAVDEMSCLAAIAADNPQWDTVDFLLRHVRESYHDDGSASTSYVVADLTGLASRDEEKYRKYKNTYDFLPGRALFKPDGPRLVYPICLCDDEEQTKALLERYDPEEAERRNVAGPTLVALESAVQIGLYVDFLRRHLDVSNQLFQDVLFERLARKPHFQLHNGQHSPVIQRVETFHVLLEKLGESNIETNRLTEWLPWTLDYNYVVFNLRLLEPVIDDPWRLRVESTGWNVLHCSFAKLTEQISRCERQSRRIRQSDRMTRLGNAGRALAELFRSDRGARIESLLCDEDADGRTPPAILVDYLKSQQGSPEFAFLGPIDGRVPHDIRKMRFGFLAAHQIMSHPPDAMDDLLRLLGATSENPVTMNRVLYPSPKSYLPHLKEAE